jgi:poly(3-hydroxybutyrate) depolymerase
LKRAARAGAEAVAALALLTATDGCRCGARSEVAGAPAPPSASAAASAAPPKKLPPLRAESWLMELPLDGGAAASVSVPLGATEPRPIVIALHGAGDRPEWQCGTWRGIADNRAFVVCPRGVPHPDFPVSAPRYTWTNVAGTETALRAALRALKARFGEHVASGSVVLTGFSLGAAHAVHLLRQEPAFFSRVVLVEGGAQGWSATLGAVFARNGGKRVLFVCTQPACRPGALTAVRLTERGGAQAELVDAGNLGHVLDGRAAAAIKPRFLALVDGDPRWKSTTLGAR